MITLPFPARPELLLCPPTPRPLHGQAPREIFGRAWWDVTRRAVYAKFRDCCGACGVHKSEAKYRKHVEAHEIYTIDYEDGTMTLREIVALCNMCHNYIHHERLQAMVDAKIYSPEYQADVIRHGESVLRAAGHTSFRAEIPEKQAPWGQWRIILDDGHPHFSKFINEQHWAAHYAAKNAELAAGKSD